MVFLIIILGIILYAFLISAEGMASGGSPQVQSWAVVRQWDGKPDADPIGCVDMIASKFDIYEQDGNDLPYAKCDYSPAVLQPPASGKWTVERHVQSNGAIMLVYYTTPCRMQYSVFIPVGDLFRATYADYLLHYSRGLSPNSIADARSLIGQQAPHLVQTDDIVLLQSVREFEFKLLLGGWGGRWGIAPKIDGRPVFIIVAGGVGMFCMRRHAERVFIAPKHELWVVAGELQDSNIYIWDSLVVAGADISKLPFYQRVKTFGTAVNSLQRWMPKYKIYPQRFVTSGKTRAQWERAVDSAFDMRSSNRTDGVVLQKMDLPYAESVILKFKPWDELTVDLLHIGTEFFSSRKDSCHNENLVVAGAGVSKRPSLVEVKLAGPTITRFRFDKQGPNSAATVKQIRQHFENRIGIADLKGSTVYLLRAWMRKYEPILYESLQNESKILDIGVGNGRSARNWSSHNFKVWGVEPDAERFKELISKRIKQLVDAKNIGGEDSQIQSWIPAGSIDAVMMIHSLTFFTHMLDALAANIRHCVRPGGMVIGIGLDGVEVAKMLKLSGGAVDCAAFSIKQLSGDQIQITMKGAASLVQAQTEYLTDFAALTRVMKSAGFSLQKTWMMPSHYMLDDMPRWFVQSTRIWIFRN